MKNRIGHPQSMFCILASTAVPPGAAQDTDPTEAYAHTLNPRNSRIIPVENRTHEVYDVVTPRAEAGQRLLKIHGHPVSDSPSGAGAKQQILSEIDPHCKKLDRETLPASDLIRGYRPRFNRLFGEAPHSRIESMIPADIMRHRHSGNVVDTTRITRKRGKRITDASTASDTQSRAAMELQRKQEPKIRTAPGAKSDCIAIFRFYPGNRLRINREQNSRERRMHGLRRRMPLQTCTVIQAQASVGCASESDRRCDRSIQNRQTDLNPRGMKGCRHCNIKRVSHELEESAKKNRKTNI